MRGVCQAAKGHRLATQEHAEFVRDDRWRPVIGGRSYRRQHYGEDGTAQDVNTRARFGRERLR
jgi:hypothetical protein